MAGTGKCPSCSILFLRLFTYSHILRMDEAGVHLKVTVVVAVILNTVSVSVLVTA